MQSSCCKVPVTVRAGGMDVRPPGAPEAAQCAHPFVRNSALRVGGSEHAWGKKRHSRLSCCVSTLRSRKK